MKKNKFFKEKKLNLINFSNQYIDYLSEVLNKIDKKDIDRLEKILENARKKNNTIFGRQKYC